MLWEKRKMPYKNKQEQNIYMKKWRKRNKNKVTPKKFRLVGGSINSFIWEISCKVLPTGGFDNRGFVGIWEKHYHYNDKDKKQHIKDSRLYYSRHSEEVKKRSQKYRKTENGKICGGKHRAKRRELGYIPLNIPFNGSSPHHINKNVVIYIPINLHRSVFHNVFTGYGMDEINYLAFDWLRSERAGAMKPENKFSIEKIGDIKWKK